MWNERRLARRAARGDPEAFAAIFRHYQQDLYRYCVAILGDPHDAQDALQNTMVKALSALPGERRRIELKPWLYRVAHNESVELRRRGRPSEPLAEDAPATEASVEQRAADRDRLQNLLADIGELPERQRGALVMRELAGLDFEQIGAALDTSPRAARQVLHEARRGLQQMSEGREMECEAVTAILSDGDGRVARRRDVRTHLRDCAGCRRFAEAIHTRGETLAAISPLPALAAAAIAKGALSGAAGGGASVGGGAAAGGASTGGAAGLAGGAAAKVATTGAVLKSAAGIVAVVAVSAVAVDHGHLFRGNSSQAEPSPPAAASQGSGGQAHVRPRAAPPGRAAVTFERGAQGGGRSGRGGHRQHAGDEHLALASAAGSRLSGNESLGTGRDRANDAGPTATPGGGHHRAASNEHPAHPAHPGHPAHPVRTGSQAHPARAAHPAHPRHPDGGSNSSHARKPSHADPTRPSDQVGQPAKSDRQGGADAESGGGTDAGQEATVVESPQPAPESTATGGSAPIEEAVVPADQGAGAETADSTQLP